MGTIFFQALKELQKDRADLLGAAIAFYATFSLAPIIVIATGIAGYFFGQDIAREHILSELEKFLGSDGAAYIGGILGNMFQPTGNILAAVIGFIVLVFSATLVFVYLRVSIDKIWKNPLSDTAGFWGLIKDSAISFLYVLATGIFVSVTLLLKALLNYFVDYVTEILRMDVSAIAGTLNNGVTYVITVFIFMVLFKYLPSNDVAWKHAFHGSVISAFLFIILGIIISFYFERAGIASIYGAAGSLVVILMWISLVAQIFLYGVEVTKVSALSVRKKPTRFSFGR